MNSKRILAALLLKDFLCIWSGKSHLVATFGFSLLLVVVASFSFRQIGYGQEELQALTPGILWTVFLFASVIGLNHSFLPEYDDGALAGLMLSPVDPALVYSAKFLSNLVYITLLNVFVLLAHALFFGVQLSNVLPELVLLIFLFCIGFVALGTLLAAVSVVLKERELILPLVLFPLMIPLVAGSIELCRGVLQSGELVVGEFWFVLVCVFDVISVSVSCVLFEFVVRE